MGTKDCFRWNQPGTWRDQPVSFLRTTQALSQLSYRLSEAADFTDARGCCQEPVWREAFDTRADENPSYLNSFQDTNISQQAVFLLMRCR